MEPESSVPCPQEPAIGPYPEPREFSPHPHMLFLYDPPQYYSSISGKIPQMFFFAGFPTKILYAFLTGCMRATCPANLILDFITVIISDEEYKLLRTSLWIFSYKE
jgi:hypothetical protein